MTVLQLCYSGLLRDGWKDIGKVFIVAVVLDVVYAQIVHRWIFQG